ncbi:MAG: hypothetical protein BJ554DRAFT_4484 [Olpidium bornovanus]|uniref:Uncharacterized protein n=1 Tax=Olpidium bornovanus TaxID=278681 RepID=A0A8H7ZMN6_9FUNG|nr:MAG: hypothetical protein BJ554DRAFT_4484 [Olpidium bornovanus]
MPCTSAVDWGVWPLCVCGIGMKGGVCRGGFHASGGSGGDDGSWGHFLSFGFGVRSLGFLLLLRHATLFRNVHVLAAVIAGNLQFGLLARVFRRGCPGGTGPMDVHFLLVPVYTKVAAGGLLHFV